MPTEKQIRQALRRNAELSTAPRAAGDPETLPLLQSGLDPESEEFARLQTEYFDRFHPATPEQRFQLDTIIRSEWSLRRFFRVEAQLWEFHAMKAERGTGVQLGEAFTKANPIFMRLQRRITAAEKSHKEAMAELRRLQQLPQPQEIKAQTQQLASFRTPPVIPGVPPRQPEPCQPPQPVSIRPFGPGEILPAVIKSEKPVND